MPCFKRLRCISKLAVIAAFSAAAIGVVSCSSFVTYESEPNSIAVDASDHIYVCNQDGIKRFDPHTGRLEAETQIRSRWISCSFGVTGAGRVYYVGSTNNHGFDVVGLSAKNGSLRQDSEVPIPGPVDESATFGVTANGTVISVADSVIYKFARTANGDLRSVSAVTYYTSSPLNIVFVAIGRDGRICSADLKLDDGATRIMCFSRRAVDRPDEVIEGPHTGLMWINGLAIGQDNSLVALCTGSPDYVLRFAPGAQGDAKPVQRIEGPTTGLLFSDGVAIDRSGRIYASVLGGLNYVNVFGPGANGNVAPEYEIRRSGDADFQPGEIAIGQDGRIYIRGATTAIFVYDPITKESPSLRSEFRTRRISMWGLFSGRSIAVDERGVVYADIGVDSIGEFQPDASGNYEQVALLRPAENGVTPVLLATDAHNHLIILGDSGDAYDYGARPSWQRATRLGFVSTIGSGITTMTASPTDTIYVAAKDDQIYELKPSKTDTRGVIQTLAGPDRSKSSKRYRFRRDGRLIRRELRVEPDQRIRARFVRRCSSDYRHRRRPYRPRSSHGRRDRQRWYDLRRQRQCESPIRLDDQ